MCPRRHRCSESQNLSPSFRKKPVLQTFSILRSWPFHHIQPDCISMELSLLPPLLWNHYFVFLIISRILPKEIGVINIKKIIKILTS